MSNGQNPILIVNARLAESKHDEIPGIEGSMLPPVMLGAGCLTSEIQSSLPEGKSVCNCRHGPRLWRQTYNRILILCRGSTAHGSPYDLCRSDPMRYNEYRTDVPVAWMELRVLEGVSTATQEDDDCQSR